MVKQTRWRTSVNFHLFSSEQRSFFPCMAYEKLQKGFCMSFFQQMLSFHQSSIQAGIVGCMTISRIVSIMSHLSCGPLQPLQSYCWALCLMNGFIKRPVISSECPMFYHCATIFPFLGYRLNIAL